MSDESDTHLKSSQSSKSKDISEGSSSTPSLYNITQEVKKRALSAYRKRLPPLVLDQPSKAKTEVIWGRKPPRKQVQDLNLKGEDASSTVADFLCDEEGLEGASQGAAIMYDDNVDIGQEESTSKTANQSPETEDRFSDHTMTLNQGERNDPLLKEDQGDGIKSAEANQSSTSGPSASRESGNHIGTDKESESSNEGNFTTIYKYISNFKLYRVTA